MICFQFKSVPSFTPKLSGVSGSASFSGGGGVGIWISSGVHHEVDLLFNRCHVVQRATLVKVRVIRVRERE